MPGARERGPQKCDSGLVATILDVVDGFFGSTVDLSNVPSRRLYEFGDEIRRFQDCRSCELCTKDGVGRAEERKKRRDGLAGLGTATTDRGSRVAIRHGHLGAANA